MHADVGAGGLLLGTLVRSAGGRDQMPFCLKVDAAAGEPPAVVGPECSFKGGCFRCRGNASARHA